MKRARTTKLAVAGSVAALALGIAACEVEDNGGGLDDPGMEDDGLGDDM